MKRRLSSFGTAQEFFVYSKACYPVFTTKGQRSNYQSKYSLELKVGNQEISLLALSFTQSFKYIEIVKEVSPKTLYKSLIRSLFDYCFKLLNH
ncbi:hypothetical protein BpHYR1_026519 [Brachionus plicatilis]|uniref:Uncharacterized protein n=1 Tax=Brachionus plicatilis TaxID=10195 RepID=A0A3M7QUR3_BRAPC|nr:hypothetical protein BpHYR1_026519 [Brachionus plicatilis]